jgi:hypothetical protein
MGFASVSNIQNLQFTRINYSEKSTMADSAPKKLSPDQLKKITLDISEDLLRSGTEKVSQTVKEMPALSGSEIQLMADIASRVYTRAIATLAFVSADDGITKQTIQKIHKGAMVDILRGYNEAARRRDQHLKSRIIKP